MASLELDKKYTAFNVDDPDGATLIFSGDINELILKLKVLYPTKTFKFKLNLGLSNPKNPFSCYLISEWDDKNAFWKDEEEVPVCDIYQHNPDHSLVIIRQIVDR
jgi:hypothetical protein